jgi:capsular exopolysaccharide synthesis family protein
MSRIFEALQRSEAARTGTPERDFTLATDLLAAAEKFQEPGAPEAARGESAAVAETEAGLPTEFPDFRPMPVSIPTDSRLVCLTARDSLAAEKFRFLGVRLRQLQQSRKVKNLLITSTMPEEGKSTICANLATTLARKGHHRVLLLEGDLRRPTLSRQFGLTRGRGLSEWLQHEEDPLNQLIYKLEEAGFWFLPAGTPPENPLELIQSGRLNRLFGLLTAWFDWVIIDSPPVLPLADTSVWARLADGILLVTREGTTQKKALQRGLAELDTKKLLGVVMNSAEGTDHTDYYQRYGPAARAHHKSKTEVKQ